MNGRFSTGEGFNLSLIWFDKADICSGIDAHPNNNNVELIITEALRITIHFLIIILSFVAF